MGFYLADPRGTSACLSTQPPAEPDACLRKFRVQGSKEGNSCLRRIRVGKNLPASEARRALGRG